MKFNRLIGSVTAVVALTAAGVLYTAHEAKSSDHQDTYNLGNAVGHNPSADITDVFVFPSPANSANVVFAMDVYPLIPTGMGTAKFFDPTLVWQFKIAHGAATNPEDQVIQLTASNNNSSVQQIAVYGPAAPNEVSTTNTLVKQTGTVNYNDASGTALSNGIKVFAGPRADPFVFDLFSFFGFLGDRNFQTHTAQADADPGNTTLSNGDNVGTAATVASAFDKGNSAPTPTFNGFAAGTMSSTGAGAYVCSTEAPVSALADLAGGFNVLTYVVEVPKTLLTTGFSSQTIHVWATVSSNTTQS